jgi:hypothetical protein
MRERRDRFGFSIFLAAVRRVQVPGGDELRYFAVIEGLTAIEGQLFPREPCRK